MASERRAGEIPQAWVTERRRVTITGYLNGMFGVGDNVRFDVTLHRDDVVREASE